MLLITVLLIDLLFSPSITYFFFFRAKLGRVWKVHLFIIILCFFQDHQAVLPPYHRTGQECHSINMSGVAEKYVRVVLDIYCIRLTRRWLGMKSKWTCTCENGLPFGVQLSSFLSAGVMDRMTDDLGP